MGYNFAIGEAEPTIHYVDRTARMSVKIIDGTEFGAPVNSSGDRSNYCYPSYLVWHNFAHQTGLYGAFYAPACGACRDSAPGERWRCSVCKGQPQWWGGEEGLLHNREHGRTCAQVTKRHLTAFIEAQEQYLAGPRFGVGEDGVDHVQRRLDWLVFWTRWSLDTCKWPSFANW